MDKMKEKAIKAMAALDYRTIVKIDQGLQNGNRGRACPE